ncbi:MAG: hypothetical protein WKG07_40675 [Hymenobacter sp.]
MPISVIVLPANGSAAVTATSLSRPTSLVSRVTRSPVAAFSWKAIDSACRCAYSSARTRVSTRLPARAKQMVMR